MTRQVDLNDVRLLMQVIEHGSFTRASRVLGVPKSTLSQRIASLERVVGTGLLRRTSRSFSLTEAGAELLPHARAIEDLARVVERSLMEQGRELRGRLRLSCSNAIGQFALSSLVPKFLDAHGEVTIRMEATNRLIDLIGEGFDMVVRGHLGPLQDSSLRQRVVARSPWAIAASPRWIEAHGAPRTPADLRSGEVLCFSTTLDCQAWTLQRGEEAQVVTATPRMVSDDMATLRASAIADGGVVRLPSYILKSSLQSGDLAPVLDEWISPASTISVLTPPKAQSSRLASAFSDFLAAEMPPVMES